MLKLKKCAELSGKTQTDLLEYMVDRLYRELMDKK